MAALLDDEEESEEGSDAPLEDDELSLATLASAIGAAPSRGAGASSSDTSKRKPLGGGGDLDLTATVSDSILKDRNVTALPCARARRSRQLLLPHEKSARLAYTRTHLFADWAFSEGRLVNPRSQSSVSASTHWK